MVSKNKHENLKRLREANRLLNKKCEQLGVKKLQLSQTKSEALDEYLGYGKPYAPEKIDDSSISSDSIKLPSEESLRKTTEIVTKTKKPFSFLRLIGFIAVVTTLFLASAYFLNPKLFSSKLSVLSKMIAHKAEKKNEFGVLNGIGFISKPVMISSGVFADFNDAIDAKKELSKVAGDALKIVKYQGRYYTIRIGPRYTNYEDAMIVFEELTKYQIRDLSIRLI